MAKEWTVQEVRDWLLGVLYEIGRVHGPSVFASFRKGSFQKATDEYPSWADIYREAEWLEWKGMIEAEFDPGVVSHVKITHAGREHVEEKRRRTKEMART